MSEQWQIRRGTTAENDNFTGAEGEITMDTDKKQLRVHDGQTQGGKTIPDIGMILNAILPDYNAGVSISSWPYTVQSIGWVKGDISANNEQYGMRLRYTPPNGSAIPFGSGELSAGNYANTQCLMFMVEPGGVLTRDSTAISATFYPAKGVNS